MMNIYTILSGTGFINDFTNTDKSQRKTDVELINRWMVYIYAKCPEHEKYLNSLLLLDINLNK